MSGSADAPAASKAAAVSSAGFASGGRRRCACGTMCFVALERRRARDTSLPDWYEIQDSDYTATLETFGSKFPGGLLPVDLRAAVAACSHSGGGGGRYSPAGLCCCCFGSPPPFPSLTSSRVRLLGASLFPLIYLYFVVLCRTFSQLRFLCLRLNRLGFEGNTACARLRWLCALCLG
jgi:hypothetical protein